MLTKLTLMRAFLFCFILHVCSFNAVGQKLFTSLSPEKTNVYFNNTIQDTKEDNIFIYSNFYGGAGVGLGDINNDGLLDIYFAGNQVGDKLYLNKEKKLEGGAYMNLKMKMRSWVFLNHRLKEVDNKF